MTMTATPPAPRTYNAELTPAALRPALDALGADCVADLRTYLDRLDVALLASDAAGLIVDTLVREDPTLVPLVPLLHSAAARGAALALLLVRP